MKIRQGFVSNSSSSSFIIRNVNNNELAVYNKSDKEWYVWTAQDVLDWVKSMIKREYKRQNSTISEENLNECVKLDTVEHVKEKLDLPYWYAGCKLVNKDAWVLYDTVDNFISYELAKKIIKKFDIGTYDLHMG